ncbi:hypothetical protein ACTMU2_35275 [Cupriavidus basilensis]
MLGLTETISWGTLFFSFTVFIELDEPRARLFRHSRPAAIRSACWWAMLAWQAACWTGCPRAR